MEFAEPGSPHALVGSSGAVLSCTRGAYWLLRMSVWRCSRTGAQGKRRWTARSRKRGSGGTTRANTVTKPRKTPSSSRSWIEPVPRRRRDTSAASSIWTVGHSTYPIDQFLDILAAHEIEQVADVRTIPKSRHNPQFNLDELRKA